MLIYGILEGGGTPWEKAVTLGLFLTAILLAIIVHEMCHGFVAYALGDPTAKRMGRLTLNPARHIDPVGALMMLAAGFGWAKPVMVDVRYFRKPKRDMALTALAGPVSNFLLAFAAAGCLRLTASVPYLPDFFFYAALLNIGLGLFNLIPIPPLDGSKALGALLPDRTYDGYMRFGHYGMFLLMALILAGNLSGGRFNAFGFLGELRASILYGMLGVFGIV